jgi:hypothetical protein
MRHGFPTRLSPVLRSRHGYPLCGADQSKLVRALRAGTERLVVVA